MASTVVCQKPSLDYFSLSESRPQNNISTYGWETSPYTDSAPVNDSGDSLSSPTSPTSIEYSTKSYSLPKAKVPSTAVKTEQSFDFGTFEDWMRWDDPSDAALSPTAEFFPEFKIEPVSPMMNGLELQGSGIGNSTTTINPADDSAIFGEDPISEEPLFQTPGTFSNNSIQRSEGLYSTPLSWERPSSGRRSQSYGNSAGLSAQQESQLRNIAMPSQSQNQSQQYANSPSSTSSPEPDNGRKRKSSAEDEDEDDDSPPTNGRHPPIKKTAHNMIEKRYRTNLNDKIAALRDSVPSLRVMSKKNSRGEDIQEDLQGLTPAHKLNKATVLSKATEYIAHLEKRNKYLMKENASLKSRVDAFEILVMSRQQQNKPQRMGQQGPSRGYSMSGMM